MQAEITVRDIFGSSYYDHNQSILPIKEAELYQAACFSTMINTGLRRGFTSNVIYEVIERLNHAIENHIPLGKELVLYRGLDRKWVPSFEGGEFTDKAFNSCSLDPDVAKFFGDLVLRITFRPEDKLLYFGGPKFYPETLEFIASPNTTYRILGRSTCGKFLEVTTTGKQRSIIKPAVTTFDTIYTRVVQTMKEKITPDTWVYVFYAGYQNIDTYTHSDISNLYMPGDTLVVGPNYNLYEDLYMKRVTKIAVCKEGETAILEEIPFLF